LKSTENQKINKPKILVEKPEGKSPLARPRSKIEYYLKIDVNNTRKDRGLRLFISGQQQAAVNTVIYIYIYIYIYISSVSVQRGGLLKLLKYYWLLKKNSSPWSYLQKNTYHEASQYADAYIALLFDHSILSNLRS